jgi:predicted nucleotide-binding protein
MTDTTGLAATPEFISGEHLLCTRFIWEPFHETGKWPLSRVLERRLIKALAPDGDVYRILSTLPAQLGQVQYGGDGSVASATVLGLVECVGAAAAGEELADFSRAFELCLRRFEEASEDQDAHLSSDDLGAAGLGMTEVAIRRTHLLLQAEWILVGGSSTDRDGQYGWDFTVSDTIARFRGVADLDAYLDVRKRMAGWPPSPSPSTAPASDEPAVRYYHVELETGLYMPPAIRLDLTEAELEQRYLVPRAEGSPLVVKGSTIPLDDIARITIRRSIEPSSTASEHTTWNAGAIETWEEAIFPQLGEDVTDDYVVGPPGSAARRVQQPARAALGGSGSPAPVFIVHGRDQARLYEVVRFLEKTTTPDSVEVRILNEAANAGQTLIEKLERVGGGAAFAVVLLTGDDEGGIAGSREYQPRARQNVIIELGYFLGTIGRVRVAILYEAGVELPSDVHGMAYIPLDPGGGWKARLGKELDHAGIHVDLNKAP